MNCIFLRRGYGTSGDGVNYVEWIKTDGNVYFDTGHIPTANTRVVMHFQLQEAGTSNLNLFGVAGQYSFRWYGASSVFRSNGANNVDFPTGIDSLAWHTVDKTATVCKLDDTYSVTNTVATCTLSLYLFAQHQATGNAATMSKAKSDYCQIYESDVLIYDYRSALDPDGVPCLYDKVNKEYLYPGGSGTVTAGASTSGGGSGGGTTPSEYAVTLEGTLDSSRGYVTINGTKYTSAQTITVTAGNTVNVYVGGSDSSASKVTLNGTTVQTGTGTYSHVVKSNCTLTFTKNNLNKYCYCAITTS